MCMPPVRKGWACSPRHMHTGISLMYTILHCKASCPGSCVGCSLDCPIPLLSPMRKEGLQDAAKSVTLAVIVRGILISYLDCRIHSLPLTIGGQAGIFGDSVSPPHSARSRTGQNGMNRRRVLCSCGSGLRIVEYCTAGYTGRYVDTGQAGRDETIRSGLGPADGSPKHSLLRFRKGAAGF